MPSVTCKRFIDQWRGDGFFCSLNWARGWLLVAVRRRWRLAAVRPSTGALRFYIGPIEVEYYTVKEPTNAE